MKREEILEAIFANMQQMHRTGGAKFHTLMEREDISRSQMELLMVVKHHQPINVKDLAARLHLTPGAVTQLVEGLVSNGYLDRQEDGRDRRVTNISLAEGGKQKLKDLWEQRKNVIKRIMQTLDTEELATMLRIQEKMFQQIEIETAKAKNKEKNT